MEANRSKITMSVYVHGDIFGTISVLTGEPREFEARSQTYTHMFLIEKAELYNVLVRQGLLRACLG